jgi:hypothetical protein
VPRSRTSWRVPDRLWPRRLSARRFLVARIRRCPCGKERPLVGGVIKEDEGPCVALVHARERLVAVVAVLQQEAAIPILREQRWWFPAALKLLSHRFDVSFPFVGRNANKCIVFGSSQPYEVAERYRDGPDPPMRPLRQRGREHHVVTTATCEKISDPERGLTRSRSGTRRREAETSHSACLPRSRHVHSTRSGAFPIGMYEGTDRHRRQESAQQRDDHHVPAAVDAPPLVRHAHRLPSEYGWALVRWVHHHVGGARSGRARWCGSGIGHAPFRRVIDLPAATG